MQFDCVCSFRQRFRVVPGSEYIAHFASDRSHMLLPSGEWSAPPPAHAPLRGSSATTAMTLPQLLDMSSLSDASTAAAVVEHAVASQAAAAAAAAIVQEAARAETAEPEIAARTVGRVVSLDTFVSEYCCPTTADDAKPG
jgi:N-terminal glutamine amidase